MSAFEKVCYFDRQNGNDVGDGIIVTKHSKDLYISTQELHWLRIQFKKQSDCNMLYKTFQKLLTKEKIEKVDEVEENLGL